MLVETQWLEDHVSDRGIRIVDLRFSRCFSNHEKVAEECRKDYQEGHIPNAVWLPPMEKRNLFGREYSVRRIIV